MHNTTSLTMPEHLKKDIDEIAQYHDKKPHWIMVRALELFAKNEKEKMRFLRERARQTQIERENGELLPADDVIQEMKAYVNGFQ